MDEEEFKLTNTLSDLSRLTQDLLGNIKEAPNEITKTLIREHLDFMCDPQCIFKPLIFPEDLNQYDWFNVKAPLSFSEDLKNSIVVLDFFTYCCINCLHILPDLEALEEKFKPGESSVLVIGVHSAKFDNEKLSDCVLDAIHRYNITHPVVNDINCKMWHEFGISCWPTLVILGPCNMPLFVLMGEGQGKNLLKFVEVSLDYFNSLSKLEVPSCQLLPYSFMPSTFSSLSYPGKVSLYPKGLIISDSGNNRVLLTDCKGNIQVCIGSGKRGFKDGTFEMAQFSNPQGAVYYDSTETIYVADTNNHAIRKVDLKDKSVTTVAGNGQQGNDKEGGALWSLQAISSPWDVILCHSLDLSPLEAPYNLLIIAMAGSHQIWGIFLSDGQWLKNVHYSEGTVVCLAGSGLEESRNTSYPLKAGFAQPSGLTLDSSSGKQIVLIADSESSSIRHFSLADGTVKRTAGGSLDPTNLFTFGDRDGRGNQALLQHPLGVTSGNGGYFVADSYNHKIKFIEKNGKDFTVHTLIGDGNAGDDCGNPINAKLNEPSGVAFSEIEKILYIADTNNHAIKIFHLESQIVSKLILNDQSSNENHDVVDSPERPSDLSFKIDGKNKTTLKLILALPSGAHLTPGSKNTFKIAALGNSDAPAELCKGELDTQTEIILDIKSNTVLDLQTRLFLCLDNGVCTMIKNDKRISLYTDDSGSSDELSIYIKPEL